MTDEDAYTRARAKYSASFMSNSKWVRLFSAIVQSGVVVERAYWSTIDGLPGFWEAFPREHEFLETRFADGAFQPFEYKWIESVFVPRDYRPDPSVGYSKRQDITALRQAVEAKGQFMIQEDDAGLTILAYRRRGAVQRGDAPDRALS